MTVFMASDQASGITGTTVNLTMGSLDDLLLRSPLAYCFESRFNTPLFVGLSRICV